ncbi:protein WHAT'S THIS FACTOR 9, mitochondrial [Dendrobium catenatum]|uniref:PORR domain-containing protein n=1 Tax=Dendrobium catenatum TaxID=906689 RepID=A0A2I0X282_9ASPA|nr:protein WHAT'S THIS FACTOR 9, mitochondrial [Dendrobium catenatum]PKU82028.1 hypothetical protein MA16_Dca004045 [Dendrobium catenatum]
MVWSIARTRRLLRRRLYRLPFAADQRATLVNVKLKWVKDRALDSVVARERHLRQVHRLLELISTDPRGGVPIQELRIRPLHLGNVRHLPSDFLLRFPALFRRSSELSSGRSSPWVYLTDDAFQLRELELSVLRDSEPELVDRLRRLLMLTAHLSLPLQTVEQLSWDMGLPSDYHKKILQCYPHFFGLVRPDDDERVWLKLSAWDPLLAVSELQRSSSAGGFNGDSLSFPVRFTRGFGLRRKCMMWLQEWQTLPYTSPYADPSDLDPRIDVSEKRIVGVFHELLHLTLCKKTERSNLSNLRKPLRLPYKFTKVFERHPGIFYLSQKLGVQTVVLREAYGGGRELLSKHPLVSIRERYAAMMNAGRPEICGRHLISEESEVVSSEVCYKNE